jgi:WD40 repeat protein
MHSPSPHAPIPGNKLVPVLLAAFLIPAMVTTESALGQGNGPLVKVDRDGEPLPPHALMRLGSLRYRTDFPMANAILSPDGRWIAALTMENVQLFDKATGKRVRQWPCPFNGYDGRNLVFSPDSAYLDFLDHKGHGFRWEVTTGRIVERYPGKALERELVEWPGSWDYSLVYTRDGRLLLVMKGRPDSTSADSPATVIIWDMASGRQQFLYQVRGVEIRGAVAVSENGERLVLQTRGSGFEGRIKLQVFNLPRKKLLATIQPQGESYALGIAPDGKTLASGGADVLEVYSDAGKLLGTANGAVAFAHQSAIHFTADNKYLLRDQNGAGVQVWSLSPLKLERVIGGANRPEYFGNSVSLSWDGKIVLGFQSNALILWDVATGEELTATKTRSHLSYPIHLGFAPDGRSLLAATAGEEAILWDLQSASARLPLAKKITSFGFHAALNQLVFTTGDSRFERDADVDLEVWDLARNEQKDQWTIYARKEGALASIPAVSADGKTVYLPTNEAGPGEDRSEKITTWLSQFDPQTGKLRAKVRVNVPHLIESSALPPLAVSADDKMAALLFSPRYSPYSKYARYGYPREGNQLCLFPPGRGNQILHVSNVLPGEMGFQTVDFRAFGEDWETWIPQWRQEIRQMRFSPNGHFLACGNYSPYVAAVESATGKAVGRWFLLGRFATALAFSPDGRYLAVADVSADIRKDYSDSSRLNFLELQTGGWKLVQNTVDRQAIRVFDMLTGEEIKRYQSLPAPCLSLTFSADGSRLASGMLDNTILLWDTGFLSERQAAVVPLSAKDLDRVWEHLTDPRAWYAHQAMHRLLGTPEQTLALFRDHFADLVPVDNKQVQQLVEALDSKSYVQRQKATVELVRLREFIEPALRQALAEKSSLEKQQRLNQILTQVPPPVSPEMLRVQRALQVLEWIGDAAARAFLGELAQRSDGTVVGEQAGAALARMGPKK